VRVRCRAPARTLCASITNALHYRWHWTSLLCAASGGDFDSSLAAKGITASCEYVGVMAEAIEQRRGELFVTEDLDPLRERQIGGDDGRAAFVALGQQIEL
jgi:hypothetical protein